MGLMIAMGSAKAQGSESKPDRPGESYLEQPERGTKRHKGWPAAGVPVAPSRGPITLKLGI
jgi:hypothetical protein